MEELISIIILALISLLGGGLIFYLKKHEKHRPDYYQLFKIGIIWFPIGILIKILDSECFLGLIFIFLGLIYSTIGFIHRAKWEKNPRPWKKLTRKEKKVKIISLGILGILILLGLIILIFVK